jgi:hypothetical protein
MSTKQDLREALESSAEALRLASERVRELEEKNRLADIIIEDAKINEGKLREQVRELVFSLHEAAGLLVTARELHEDLLAKFVAAEQRAQAAEAQRDEAIDAAHWLTLQRASLQDKLEAAEESARKLRKMLIILGYPDHAAVGDSPQPPTERAPEPEHGTFAERCLCPGCSTMVPGCWKAGMCFPCASEDCEHEPPAEAHGTGEGE